MKALHYLTLTFAGLTGSALLWHAIAPTALGWMTRGQLGVSVVIFLTSLAWVIGEEFTK